MIFLYFLYFYCLSILFFVYLNKLIYIMKEEYLNFENVGEFEEIKVKHL